ncbi:MAG: hypothetical protein ACTHU0_14470 [Kofleriaceae bacterium]
MTEAQVDFLRRALLVRGLILRRTPPTLSGRSQAARAENLLRILTPWAVYTSDRDRFLGRPIARYATLELLAEAYGISVPDGAPITIQESQVLAELHSPLTLREIVDRIGGSNTGRVATHLHNLIGEGRVRRIRAHTRRGINNQSIYEYIYFAVETGT